MIIKEVTKNDLDTIEELNKMQDGFKLRSLDNCIIDRLAFENGDVIAYGIVKKLAEACILVNHKMPKITRAKAMRELMKYAELGAKKAGCEQLHCFTKNNLVALTLERQFGFERNQDIVTVKNL